jgi:hypothetical protein
MSCLATSKKERETILLLFTSEMFCTVAQGNWENLKILNMKKSEQQTILTLISSRVAF